MKRFLRGLVFGLVYSSLFEYGYHRWLLHGEGGLAEGHDLHHRSWGREDESKHVDFERRPVLIAMALSGSAASALRGWRFGIGATAAMAAYAAAFVKIHRAIHLSARDWGWLRRHHFEHHASGDRNFNVLLPLGDGLEWIVKSTPERHGGRKP